MLLDASKGQAMDRGGAEPADRVHVQRTAVTLVPAEAVSGMNPVQFPHQPVTGNLGYDRGCGDGEAEGIPFFDGFLGDGRVDVADAVDQDIIRLRGKL